MYKKHLIALFSFFIISANAQQLKPIPLKSPDLSLSATLMQTLSHRASVRSFAETELSELGLSNLLWAANGINRPQNGLRTAPSALNSQDIDIYVINKEGVYLYDASKHILNPVQKGDFRSQIGGQDYVAIAPVNLILVSDLSRFKQGDQAQKDSWAKMDAGMVSQNISLYCAATGLGTVPRSMINIEKMKSALKLSNSQRIMLNHPVGYPK